jgi:hypothetical protein
VAEARPPAEFGLPPALVWIKGDWIKGDWIEGELSKGAPSWSQQRQGGAGAIHLKQQLSHLPE